MSSRHLVLVATLLALGLVMGGCAHSTIAFLAVSESTWQVWRMSPSGKGPRQVTSGSLSISRISCAADGRRLLASTSQGDAQLIDLASGSIARIPLQGRKAMDATLSPDGTRVAFSSSSELYVTGIDGNQLRKVDGLPPLQQAPAWSRDGRWIYFVSGDPGSRQDLWRVSPDTGVMEQLTTDGGHNVDVAPGPGDLFVFASNRSGDYEVWMARPPPAVPVRLTDHRGVDAQPSLHRDGTEVVFERVDDGVSNIWKLRVGSNKPVQLTRRPGGARGPVWCGE